MRQSGLAARIAALERRQVNQETLPPLMFTIYPEQAPGEVVAANTGGGSPMVAREAFEPLDAFVVRASALLGQRLICAVYQ